MLGAIAGDIVGSRFEHGPAPQPGFTLFHRDCRFTDDSVCNFAVADALLGTHDFAASLRAFVRRHPTRGYGKMFLDWAMSDNAPAYGSWANGAPMRVAPVGWLAHDENEALAWAAAQPMRATIIRMPSRPRRPLRSRSCWRARACQPPPCAGGSPRISAMS